MARGDYYEPTPLDFKVLEVLPDDGMIGGLRWTGRRARDVRSQINEGLPEGIDPVSISELQSRLRAMHVKGLVKRRGGAQDSIWSRTDDGVAFLATKDEVLS
jgi:hypothetical protein